MVEHCGRHVCENDGETVYMTENAQYGDGEYHAKAIGLNGRYEVTWSTKAGFDYDECDDQGDACDWDHPDDIEFIGSRLSADENAALESWINSEAKAA